jgi:hypothetical protein
MTDSGLHGLLFKRISSSDFPSRLPFYGPQTRCRQRNDRFFADTAKITAPARTSTVQQSIRHASPLCHMHFITSCFVENFSTLCGAQKVLDIHRHHPKIGVIAAMHNTSQLDESTFCH